jgi:spermidine/putrescine transport system permease protein
MMHTAPRRPRWPRYALLAPALGVTLVGVGLPLLLLCAASFWTQHYLAIDHAPSLGNYHRILHHPLYATLLWRSLWVSLTSSVAAVVLAYPMAYLIAFHGGRYRTTWLVLVALPFWTSYLLRTFAWKVILGYNGLINSTLLHFALIDKPLDALLYNPLAVIITLTHAWVPFVMLPLYVSLSKIDGSVVEAARDLGDGPARRFVRVILPLSLPGVVSGTLLGFIPTVGDYVTPALVGGMSGTLVGNAIQGQFGRANNWPMGAALSMIVILAIGLSAAALRGSLSRLRGMSR